MLARYVNSLSQKKLPESNFYGLNMFLVALGCVFQFVGSSRLSFLREKYNLLIDFDLYNIERNFVRIGLLLLLSPFVIKLVSKNDK